jgi:small subunit ribosomal protein S7
MQKRALFIPQGSNPLYEKFINYIMLAGKKNVARRIFDDAMETVGNKTKEDPTKIFNKAIDNIKPQMEVKPKRIGGAVYQIPREVNANRQITLAFGLLGLPGQEKDLQCLRGLRKNLCKRLKGRAQQLKRKKIHTEWLQQTKLLLIMHGINL